MSTEKQEIYIYETLIDFLRANVSDPMGRGDPTWIIAAFPEIGYTKPAMSVLEAAQTYRRELSDRICYGYRYQVDIFVSRKNTATINSTKYSGGHLCAYLSSKTKDVLEKNGRAYFNTNLAGFLDLKLILANTPPYNEGADEYRKTLGVIIEIERPKT